MTITREQNIRRLQAAGLRAASQNRRLRAKIIQYRLSSLVTQQIKAELRAEKRSA